MESLETVLVAVAAVIIALEQGLVDAPTLSSRLPRWTRSRRWRYAPAVCVAIAAIAFTWRNWTPNTTLPPPVKERVVYVDKVVPISDPKQAAEIARLQALLDERDRKQKKEISKQPVQSVPAPTSQPVSALKQEDQDLLDGIRCEKARQSIQDDLEELISWGNIAQIASGGKNTIRPTGYSEWIAKVESYFASHSFRLFDISEFRNAHGNEWMKAPAGLDAESTGLWREIEAKKAVIRSLKFHQSNSRC